MNWTGIGALMGALGVTLGAFGAHGLDSYFQEKYKDTEPKKVCGEELPASAKYLRDFQTGVRYHMYHVVGLLAVGVLSNSGRQKSLEWAGWLFLMGIVLFSGALYILTIAGSHAMGIRWGLVAPFGGTAFILGWLMLGWSTLGRIARRS
ncbi:MAG: DUF423 domain-containing protein [Planctomycetaceae bacterium]